MLSLIVIAAVVVGLYVLVYYNFIKGPRCKSSAALHGKTVIVTGGNTGIGKMTAVDLARRGARVILACRSKQRGETAVYDIRKETGNMEVLFMPLDLASLKSVRSFTKAFLNSEPRLDILINNAGVGALVDDRTSDGFNMCFGVNHLGHFLLTSLLLQRLKECSPSRIVVVASKMYLVGKLDFSALYQEKKGYAQLFASYSDSKLCNILFVRELANKLEGTNVTCYSVHPGLVDTEIFRYFKFWIRVLLFPFAKLFYRDAENGAQTSIYCAVQEGIEQFSGQYFADCHVQEVAAHARDDAVAKKLWEVSERLAGLAA